MKNLIKVTSLIMVIALVLSGCGTTKNETSDESTGDTNIIAEKSQAANSALVILINKPAPQEDWITNTDFLAVPAGSTVEVYKGYPYTAENFIGSTVANDRGCFTVPTGTSDSVDNWVFYLTVTEQGKRRSDAVILSK